MPRNPDEYASLLGQNFTKDEAAREALQAWLSERWRQKDERIEEMLGER